MSNKEDRLYKYNLIENRNSALHMTFEFNEKGSNIRVARTYFLNNLSKNYMKDYYFSEEEEYRKPD